MEVGDGRFWDGALLPLLSFCEAVYTDNRVLRDLLAEFAGEDWKAAWAERRPSAGEGEVHAAFEPLYASLGDTRQFHEAVQHFLRIKTAL